MTLNYGTANLFEVLWTLIAMIGLFVALPNWAECAGDRKALLAAGINGTKLTLARSNVRIHRSISLFLLGFTQMGFVFMFTPPAPTPSGFSFAGLDLVLVMIPINIWLGLWSYKERKDRYKVLAAIRREGVPSDKVEIQEGRH